MCEKQEDFIYMLEDIADMKRKTITKEDRKSTKKSVNLAEPIEKMKEQFQNLDKAEREKLLEGCRMMYEDSASAADQCQTTAALIISTLAAIISALSLSVNAANIALEIKITISCGVMIFIVLIAAAAIYPMHRIHNRLKIADKYRNACLALIALSGDNKEGKTEESL